MILAGNYQTEIPGKILRKSQAADPLTGTYWVEISPTQATKVKLAAGMFGKAILSPTFRTDGWQIPYEALLDAQGDVGYVFVSTDGKVAKKVKLSLGKIAQNTVQVISGLEGYNQLIVTGSAYLADGSTIEIRK
jgi:multidrug efflux pump subunit AcrA (membrane-fusion protein)